MGSIVSSIFGGGGGRSAPAAPSSSGTSFNTSVIREAPGVEERKIELMDLARGVAEYLICLGLYSVDRNIEGPISFDIKSL